MVWLLDKREWGKGRLPGRRGGCERPGKALWRVARSGPNAA